MAAEEEISREDAMLRLNDWAGRLVFLGVTPEPGSTIVVHVLGELRHWTDRKAGGAGHRQDDTGRYYVGDDASFTITDPRLPPATFHWADEHVRTGMLSTIFGPVGATIRIRLGAMEIALTRQREDEP